MYKTTANFRIPKQVKRTMATIVDASARNAYKNSMIQAQMFEMNTRPKGKGKKAEE
jgi:hypothetical protein